jgi:hypothetical protein
VRNGQQAALVLTAQPDRVLPARVVRVTPMATLAGGRNVFEVEVGIEAAAGAALSQGAKGARDAALRPGMRGVARLDVGRMPRMELWTRDALAWLRLAAWRWIG